MDEFEFTLSNVAKLLGKSPVTLRKWEKQGIYEFPRVSGDRKLQTCDLQELASIARDLNRISTNRYRMIVAVCSILRIIEDENRDHRTTAGGKNAVR